MIEFDPRRYIWEQVAEEIKRRIDTGEYGPTFKLAELALADDFGVSRETVRRALAHLREQGVIVTLHGRGSFPAAPPASSGDDGDVLR